MEDERITLSGLWVSTMLIYLLGDVMRIFSGDFTAGEMEGVQVTQAMWLVASLLMLIPIIMVFLSLKLRYKANRWTNIILAVFFFAFNLFGLPTYPGLYDRFLLAVSLVFNALTVWNAWKWQEPEVYELEEKD